MSGPEHYREAERLLNSDHLDEGHVAVAQVHATLALAAATAAPVARGTTYAAHDAAWHDVAGVAPKSDPSDPWGPK